MADAKKLPKREARRKTQQPTQTNRTLLPLELNDNHAKQEGNRKRVARGPRSKQGAQSENHRVMSCRRGEYDGAGTQAMLRVSLLAAGFVIGARGVSVRLIGQVTGATVQSWTQPQFCTYNNNNHPRKCRPPARLFWIEGKKTAVQAAVSLIEQAVAKYKELCECKRRGEFVEREHIINDVEFYYQPPPRKALLQYNNSNPPSSSIKLLSQSHPVINYDFQEDSKLQASVKIMPPQYSDHNTPDSGLNAESRGGETEAHFCQGSTSLFSVFGNGGLPLPISPPASRNYSFLNHTVSSASPRNSPFDFPFYDFLRFDRLSTSTNPPPLNPSLATANDKPNPSPNQSPAPRFACVVCLKQLAEARLMMCGHASFCFSCAQGMVACPLCCQKVVAMQILAPMNNGIRLV